MKKTNGSLWLYGHHAVVAALQNPNREKMQLKMTKESVLPEKIIGNTNHQIAFRQEIDSLVGQNAVHQGLALLVKPLPQKTLDEVLETIPQKAVILILDQVTDPHNIGAILRSAAAFDAVAVVIPDACAPEESAVLAKSACGALEIVPLIRVTNLVRAMQQLKDAGFWCLGLDGYAKEFISDKKLPAHTAFVLGSEGDGMRRLTAENCDYTIKLPISDKMESLNVSNAAAVALYEFYRQR
ncbi:MAG: 23S rRNA (guanosine(2251)-2'-O)-methyltransferase RlmB [Alphaproteobacteria bacterium]|nr:23S rRNA (guanosine(2251)-2'-O)-methyltransferase RlmB [Alphaproteobacteria bacterium]